MVSGASIRRRGRNNSAANCSRSSGEAVKIGRNFVIDGNWDFSGSIRRRKKINYFSGNMDKRDQVVKNNLIVDELNLKIIEY